jgi:hypothetical protein
MIGDDGLAPRGEWWVGVMGRVVSFGELCPAQPANMRRWGSLRGSIPSLVNSLAASKTLWGQSMLVTWIDCVGVELRDVECAQRSCSAVDSQMRGFAGESEGRVQIYASVRRVREIRTARGVIGIGHRHRAGGPRGKHVVTCLMWGVESVSQCLPWQ